MKNLKIAIGSDHGGFELKSQLLGFLRDKVMSVVDCGTHSKDAVDYPRIAYTVGRLVASGQANRGIMIDGAGIGSAMAINKVNGARAAACYNVALAKNSREHNDANVLTLGSGQTNFELAQQIVEAFLTTECVEDRHKKRVALINAIENGPIEVGPHQATLLGSTGEQVKVIQPELENVGASDMDKITKRVQELLAAQAATTVPTPSGPAISIKEIPNLIDHTILRPDTNKSDIEQLCKEARQYKFFSVCVNPTWVTLARQLLDGSGVKVCCVVGFPLGAQPPETKAMEARAAIRQGAKEIDMVINVGALRSGDDELVLRDIRAVVEACRDGSAKCKVILETSLLSNAEKQRACELAVKARADFVKTSTGFSTGGATVEDVSLMSRIVRDKGMYVKASGGVRSYADLRAMVQAGATRIGTSSGIKIMQEASGQTVTGPAAKY
ncbi:MAG: Deoxyribose-phosphate aldolase [Verrucomicrobiales bacterium]|nr:Deoxyribose-phosphate aldolase [Verrucomicrobiales bacterium]